MKASTPDVLDGTEKCQHCKMYRAVLQCRTCGKKLCNLHFCDVCRHCRKDCICWQQLNTVYHPPLQNQKK